jgi:hypothetical protein
VTIESGLSVGYEREKVDLLSALAEYLDAASHARDDLLG